MIRRNDAVCIDERTARKTLVLRNGINGERQVTPVDQIVADGVPPVLPRVFRRIGLVKQVPAALPEAQSIGIVQSSFMSSIATNRTSGVSAATPVKPSKGHVTSKSSKPGRIAFLAENRRN